MRRIALLIYCLSQVLLPATLDNMPDPPAGYSWLELEGTRSFMLLPDSWHYLRAVKGSTEGFFISKEDVTRTRSFRTYLSVNCIRDVMQKTGESPSEYATSYVARAATERRLLERTPTLQGAFKGLRIRYVSGSSTGEIATVCELFVANDRTGTLFIVRFQAPSTEWTDAWKTGDTILKQLLLNEQT